jgi:hypothetical protein
MTRRFRTLVLGVAMAVCLGGTAHAQIKDENVLVTMPAGFEKAGTRDTDGINSQVWTPAGQTLENWTDMVLLQVFLNQTDIDPAELLDGIAENWSKNCKGTQVFKVEVGRVNGYAMADRMLQCPLASAGKPETGVYRGIQGNDSFYLVQRIVRGSPAPDQFASLKKYISTVTVCDPRSRQHPCPK